MSANEPLIGDLRKTPMPELFRHLYRGRLSGVLDLQQEKDQRRVFLVEGEVKSAVSNDLSQKVGRFLRDAGHISEEDVEQALGMKEDGQRVGRALVQLGAIDQETLERELRRLVASIVYSAFAWSGGYFRFRPGSAPVPADVMLTISTANLILEAIRRIEDDEQIQAGIGDLEVPLQLTEDPFLRLQHVTLTPEEGFFLSRIDGRQSASQLLRATPLDAARAIRLIYGLLATGILEGPDPSPACAGQSGSAMNVQIAARRTTTSLMTPQKTVDPSMQKAEISYRRRKIEATHRRLAQLQAHEILEVAPNPTFRELRLKYNELVEIYHPDLGFRAEYADLKQQMTEIFRKLQSSFETMAARVGAGPTLQ